VDAVIEEEPAWYTRLVETYTGPEGAELCEFIGRTESLEEDLELVLKELGYGEEVESRKHVVKKLKRVNESNALVTVAFSPEVCDKVKRAEKVVVRRFYEGEKLWRRMYAGLAPKVV